MKLSLRSTFSLLFVAISSPCAMGDACPTYKVKVDTKFPSGDHLSTSDSITVSMFTYFDETISESVKTVEGVGSKSEITLEEVYTCEDQFGVKLSTDGDNALLIDRMWQEKNSGCINCWSWGEDGGSGYCLSKDFGDNFGKELMENDHGCYQSIKFIGSGKVVGDIYGSFVLIRLLDESYAGTDDNVSVKLLDSDGNLAFDEKQAANLPSGTDFVTFVDVMDQRKWMIAYWYDILDDSVVDSIKIEIDGDNALYIDAVYFAGRDDGVVKFRHGFKAHPTACLSTDPSDRNEYSSVCRPQLSMSRTATQSTEGEAKEEL